MDLEELRLLRLKHQFLLSPQNVGRVDKALCGFQAQFLQYALHNLAIRTNSNKDTGAPGKMIRHWTLRGTLHLIPADDIALYLSLADADLYRSNNWNAPSFWNQRPSWHLTPQRQSYLSDVILDVLSQGPTSREELKRCCQSFGMTEDEERSMFDPWGGGLRQLCERGFIAYTPEAEKRLMLLPEIQLIPREKAELILAGRYFTNYGPASVHDAVYFFRVSEKKVRRWLSALEAECITVSGREYFLIPQKQMGTPAMPPCLFLAGFDPLMLGYEKKESIFMDPADMRSVFSMAGIIAPVVLLHGWVKGKWKMVGRKLHITQFSAFSDLEKRIAAEKATQIFEHLQSIAYE